MRHTIYCSLLVALCALVIVVGISSTGCESVPGVGFAHGELQKPASKYDDCAVPPSYAKRAEELYQKATAQQDPDAAVELATIIRQHACILRLHGESNYPSYEASWILYKLLSAQVDSRGNLKANLVPIPSWRRFAQYSLDMIANEKNPIFSYLCSNELAELAQRTGLISDAKTEQLKKYLLAVSEVHSNQGLAATQQAQATISSFVAFKQ